MIVRGKTKVSAFVNLVEAKLRFFWEMRNQLVHGYRLEQKHYMYVSDHAIEQIEQIHDELITPQTVGEVVPVQMSSAQVTDTLQETFAYMRTQWLNYLPIYDGQQLIGVLSFQDMMLRVNDRSEQGDIDMSQVTIADIRTQRVVEYTHIPASTSIYDVEHHFVDVDVLLVSETGASDEPVLWLLDARDVLTRKEKRF